MNGGALPREGCQPPHGAHHARRSGSGFSRGTTYELEHSPPLHWSSPQQSVSSEQLSWRCLQQKVPDPCPFTCAHSWSLSQHVSFLSVMSQLCPSFRHFFFFFASVS